MTRSLHDECYARNTPFTLNKISTQLLLQLYDTSVVGLLVPEGIVRPVISVIKYIYYLNLQFLSNVIIINITFHHPQEYTSVADISDPVLPPPPFRSPILL